MVHSGSASPMTTTPTASPQLTVPAPAPPLQALPLLDPPLPTTTDQDLTQTPAKLLTPALTTSSGSAQPCTPTPSEVEPPTLNPGKALSTNSDLASIQSPVQTPVPTQNLVNGRSSGRKRTPKACDCCGPNSKGHDVKASGRGKGRGRGRGAGRDVGDTSKRKGVRSQLTRIKKFELTEEEEEGEDTDDEFEKMQNFHAVNIAESQAPVDLPITFSNQDGPMRNCVAQEGAGAQKDSVINKQEGAGVRKGGEKSAEAGIRLQGTRGRGVLLGRGRGGKGMMVATDASDIEMKVGEKRGGGAVISPETLARAGSMSKQRQNEEEAGAEMEQGEHTDSGLATSSPGNGLNLSGGGTSRGGEEAEVKADDVNAIGTGNGVFVSGQSSGSTSTSGNAQNPDSEMQVDQDPAPTVPVWTPGNMSNGDITVPADKNHGSTCMESCILVCTTQHRWALRDHRLYCQPGTWEKDEEEEEEEWVVAGKELSGQRDGWQTDGQTQDKDSQELLTEMIHDFLESFYMKYGSFIPLSETDVLEYLKKKGNSDLNNRKLDIPGEVRRYRAGLASVPVAGFMVSYNKHTLSLEDLGTLEEQNWLNDQVINMYGELIMEATQHKVHFFNSFFHKQLAAKGYEGVKRWTKKVDLFSKWLLLVPIHLEIHWSLITVDMATKTISYYDSQGIVFKHTIDNIMKYLQSEAREKKQTAYQKGWRMVIIKGIPQQKNDSDCGVFVLEYCRRLSVKQPLRFSQEDMPHIRKRIYKELCDCRLSD